MYHTKNRRFENHGFLAGGLGEVGPSSPTVSDSVPIGGIGTMPDKTVDKCAAKFSYR